MSNIIINPVQSGLLVHMSTSLKGNTRYRVTDLGEVVSEDGSIITEWETERTIIDPVEHARAIKLRTKMRGMILKVCITTGLSNILLCPKSKEPELRDAIAEAQRLADEFNQTARIERMGFHVYVGEVRQNDALAIKTIASEVRQLIEEMQSAVIQMDPKAVRANANKLTVMGQMLTRDARLTMKAAIEAARAMATEATKLAKSGEIAAVEIDKQTVAKIDKARTAFLDIEESAFELAAFDQQPKMAGRALDL